MYLFFRKLTLPGSLWLALLAPVAAQQPTDSLSRLLWGRWEVVAYAEQGVPVDKKAAPLPQARAVYERVRHQRATNWYGLQPYEDLSRRASRDFHEWEERDSSIEVSRLAEAIAMPYLAVFFPDSTLSLYNKDALSGQVQFPEARHYTFVPATMSLDISHPGGFGVAWQAQVLRLTADRLTLFLPEDAEVVELVKTAFSLP